MKIINFYLLLILLQTNSNNIIPELFRTNFSKTMEKNKIFNIKKTLTHMFLSKKKDLINKCRKFKNNY